MFYRRSRSRLVMSREENMAPPRPSAYRKSLGRDKGKDSIYLVSIEARQMKEQEKDQMKKLNNRLVNYVDKVHDLEMMNRFLTAENEKLKKLNKTEDVDVSAIYDDELKRLREKVEELQTKNAELEIEKDNLQYELEDVVVRLDTVKEENKDLEKEVKSLSKDVDDATIERVSLEAKIENLQEALQLEKQVHEAEMENLRRQVAPVEAPVLQAEQTSILPDLNDAIQKVRKQYEAFNAKSIEDLDNFYKEKVESLSKQLKAANDDIRDLRSDNSEKRKVIHQLEMELEALRGKNDGLERNQDGLEDRHAREIAEYQEQVEKMRSDLDGAKQDIGKYLKDYQDLNSLKLSLEQEIAIYNKILMGEEHRIAVIDTKTLVLANDSKRSSRASSKSSSRSSSRSSSSARSTSDIVEEMLEKDTPAKEPSTSTPKAESEKSSSDNEEQTVKTNNIDEVKEALELSSPREESVETPEGVISVSWKVKGGTVRPIKPFHPLGDAELLYKAMQGLGTDEETISEILTKRTKAQRLVIAKHYEEKYKKELLKDLESELSGNFLSVVQHLMWRKSVLDARALRKAIKGFGTDEAVLIEILCTQSSKDIEDIKRDYYEVFERDLTKDIESETSGAFKKFLVAIMKANRPADSGTVVSNLADEDAKALFEMGVKQWSPSNDRFLEIFTQRSYQHLWYLFKQSWPKLTAADLIETVEKECPKDLVRGLKTLIRFSTCIPPLYYAIQINETMAGKGTEEKQLTYIVTTRSEIDLIDVKEEYERVFGVKVEKRVEDETSGKYKTILLDLLN
ncbi:intermediate filament IF-Fb isoform X1 [Ciona intestinalis]